MPSLKYLGYTVALQEVPDEVSLVFNISGCPYRCEGCHSPYLWEDAGEPLLPNVERIVGEYSRLITCVCFMGGDQQIADIACAMYWIRAKFGLKTCLYSGSDDLERLKVLAPVADYIKVGSYHKELGGLDSPATNQRMYKVEGCKGKYAYTDITSKFWRTV